MFNKIFIELTITLAVLGITSSLPHFRVKTLQISDESNTLPNVRTKRYTLEGNAMKTKDLVYKFALSTKKLLTNEIRTEIQQAFEVWSEYTDLTFKETETERANFNIILSENGYAGLTNSIDDDGMIFGDVEWVINIPIDNEIFYTAAHIIGHTLGLGHSDQYALMAPQLHRFKTPFKLPLDDILGIVELYGKRTNYS